MSPLLVRTDVVILTSHGDPIALVEVKNREELTAEVATKLRRNLVVHGLVGHVPYFLLVSQDRGFLWDQRGASEPLAPPSTEFSMIPVVRRYLPQIGSEERLRGAQLELVVAQWLNDLATGAVDLHSEPERSLVSTGFLTGIRGGTVRTDVAA